MTKSIRYTAIWKEWKLINPHLLRAWSTCKIWFEVSYADFVSSAPWHEHFDHPSNLRFESDAFCASGLAVMGFLVWEERSEKQDLRVVVGWGFLFQVFERQPLVLIQVLRWRGWGEWTMQLLLLLKNLVYLMLSLKHRWLFLPVVYLYLIVL